MDWRIETRRDNPCTILMYEISVLSFRMPKNGYWTTEIDPSAVMRAAAARCSFDVPWCSFDVPSMSLRCSLVFRAHRSCRLQSPKRRSRTSAQSSPKADPKAAQKPTQKHAQKHAQKPQCGLRSWPSGAALSKCVQWPLY